MSKFYIDTLPFFADLLKSKLEVADKLIIGTAEEQNQEGSWILVRQRNGTPAGIDYFSLSKISFNILIQSKGHENARQKAYTIYNSLKENFNFEIPVPAALSGLPVPSGSLGPLNVKHLQPIDEPYSLGHVGKGYFQYALNYNLQGRFLQQC